VTRSFAYVVSAMLALSSVASAQRADSGIARRPNGRPLGGRMGRGAAAASANEVPGNQQALVRQVRQRFNQVVRRQLNLTADQSRQLMTVQGKFNPQRNQIQRDERQSRLALRAAMQDTTGTGPNQDKIAQHLSELVQAQHRRADLVEAEQKELATFLTPLQRAKYQGLSDQLTKRLEALKKTPVTSGSPANPGPPEPPSIY